MTGRRHILSLELADTQTLSQLVPLLRWGFLLELTRPRPLEELLTNLPAFDRSYLDTRIQTVFVNNSAIDDLEQQIFPGDTVALSAAMPGLAGAIFRCCGQHGSLRSQTTPDDGRIQAKTSFITMKLFNMIGAEKGTLLLGRGILVRSPMLTRFLRRRLKRIGPAIKKCILDGHHADIISATDKLASCPVTLLTARSVPNGSHGS